MRMSKRHRKESTSEEWRLRAARRIVALLAALVVSLTLTAAASANVSFIKAYGWGVVNGASQLETCTTTCQTGIYGSGAGEPGAPVGVATDPSGDVYVADANNNRIEEFSAAGAFIKAYGWGVSDGASQFETCTTTCQAGIAGGGAGQLDSPQGVAIDSSGDVYVAAYYNERIDEFSAAGAFIKAYGWGVSDGASQFETCTTTCEAGIPGGAAGQFDDPEGAAIDPSGDVYVADQFNRRIEEFSAAGAFIKAYGWGVSNGADQLETCTSSCQQGILGGGAGQFYGPAAVATDSSGDVYVTDLVANSRIEEFSAAGAFIKAYGWGVSDGASQFETCTTTCQSGIPGGGAGQVDGSDGVATDPSGDVYVTAENRINEFSAAGAFIKAYGWGVADGASQFETCTTTCQTGFEGGGAGQFYTAEGVATDSSGDVYVADYDNFRIDEFGAGQSLASPPPASLCQSGKFTVTPHPGQPGELVSLTGTDFGSTPGTVYLNNIQAHVTYWADDNVIIAIPVNTAPGVFSIRVACADGNSTSGPETITKTKILPPVAQAVAWPKREAKGSERKYQLDGSSSYDPNRGGKIVAYWWYDSHGRLLGRSAQIAQTLKAGAQYRYKLKSQGQRGRRRTDDPHSPVHTENPPGRSPDVERYGSFRLRFGLSAARRVQGTQRPEGTTEGGDAHHDSRLL